MFCKKHKYILEFIAPALGGTLAFFIPQLFPKDFSHLLRIFFGMLSGMNFGFVLGFARRYLQISKEKGAIGLPIVTEAALSLVDRPLDNEGNTLPPDTISVKKQKNKLQNIVEE